MDRALIVDVETTGLNAERDKIIEIGLIEFKLGSSGHPTISSMYAGTEDPKTPLEADIARITGLTDDVLADQSIDWDLVVQIWRRADVIIAHNAEFDRKFLMARSELSSMSKHWACSLRHIDWREKHFTSQKLQHLAADHGFVNPFAHRALFDCATTFRLVTPHLSEMITSSYEPEYEVMAVGSPFESKDTLKSNGYRWNQETRVWQKRVGARRIQLEREFLASEVYRGSSRHVEEVRYFNPPHNLVES